MSFPEGTPTVEVVLDQPRTLGFTLGAMRRIKETLGTLEIDTEAGDEGLVTTLPSYIWACMDAEGRAALSIEQVEDMIHPRNMGPISQALRDLFEQSAPEGAEGNAGSAAKKKAARK